MDANFIAYEVSSFLPFEFDVIFESDSLREELEAKGSETPKPLVGDFFDSALAIAYMKFNKKFESTFGLGKRKFSVQAIDMAKETMSNLIGGIGFFSGQAIVKAASSNAEKMHYWQANLYTAVPSRSFFPRYKT